MHLSKMQYYATRFIQILQKESGPVHARRLADSIKITEGMVQQVAIPLLKARLITSSRGKARGGYSLRDHRREITVGRVLAAVPQRGRIGNRLARKVERIVMHRLNRLPVADL
jgi:DNA-binding IscR family transcriptional regulator